jgi:hypothetical protein
MRSTIASSHLPGRRQPKRLGAAPGGRIVKATTKNAVTLVNVHLSLAVRNVFDRLHDVRDGQAA